MRPDPNNPVYLLLCKKPLCDWTPEEYREYVRSLYETPAPKRAPAGLKASLTKKGKLSVRTSRRPKYALRAEIDAIASGMNLPVAEVWNFLKAKNYLIADAPPQKEVK